MICIYCMLYAVSSGNKARCHCEQLNKQVLCMSLSPLSCPAAISLYTWAVCSDLTWLWAMLKLWGRGRDLNERSGVSDYITVAMKGSHEIRALVMIGFVFCFVWRGFLLFCFKRARRLYPGGIIIQKACNLGRLYPHTKGIPTWILNPQWKAKWELQPSPRAP